jgi:thymidine phosphorylase
MRAVDVIQRKRDGQELAPEEITAFIDGYTRGVIPTTRPRPSPWPSTSRG